MNLQNRTTKESEVFYLDLLMARKVIELLEIWNKYFQGERRIIADRSDYQNWWLDNGVLKRKLRLLNSPKILSALDMVDASSIF